jgi:hypothetical protein
MIPANEIAGKIISVIPIPAQIWLLFQLKLVLFKLVLVGLPIQTAFLATYLVQISLGNVTTYQFYVFFLYLSTGSCCVCFENVNHRL